MKIVLLPGMDGTGQLFAPLVEKLPSCFEPQIVSYPNEPANSYDDLMRLVTQAMPTDEPFVLLAESFSGPLAIKLAAASPKNLLALVLCATFAENPLLALPRWIHLLIVPPLFSIPPPRTLLRHLLLGKRCQGRVADTLVRVARSIKPEVVASRIRLVLTANERQALRSCDVPILYLQATRDRLVGSHCAEMVLALNPQVRKTEIDAPHLLLQCEPEQAARAIKEFCTKFKLI